MAEIDAKVNMSLDEIIKMTRQEKKKKSIATGGKGGLKKNTNRNLGNLRQRGGLKVHDPNFRKNARTAATNTLKKRSQAWRLQRRQPNVGFVGKRYKQQNGNLKRSVSSTNLNKIPKKQQQQQHNNNKLSGFVARRTKTGKIGLTRSYIRTNNKAAATVVKKFFTNKNINNNNNNNSNNNNKKNNNINNNKGLKRTNSLPDLRDPNSVHNRLGYQSPAQVAYRNRVKRAKQLLLQRQTQKQLPNDQMLRRPNKFMSTVQQRAFNRMQHIMTSQKLFSNSGLRSDQILRSQRRAQYAQKFMRINAARMNSNLNPNTNFICTLGKSYDSGYHQRAMSLGPRQNRPAANNFQQLAQERSSYRSSRSNLNTQSRAPLAIRARSRSRSRSRTRPTAPMQTSGSTDDRSFSEVMYSVSNNLGVTGRTLNDRFSF